jgi:hypothetical protein
MHNHSSTHQRGLGLWYLPYLRPLPTILQLYRCGTHQRDKIENKNHTLGTILKSNIKL